VEISLNAGNSQRGIPQGLCMVSLTCKDLGIDCSFKTTGTTENEIMKKFIDHAESAHNMPVLTAEVMLKVKKVLKRQK
jgi:predicted small metal-binding protein